MSQFWIDSLKLIYIILIKFKVKFNVIYIYINDVCAPYKGQGFNYFLESSSRTDNIWRVIGRSHHKHFPRILTHQDPWLRGISDLMETPIVSERLRSQVYLTTIFNKNHRPPSKVKTHSSFLSKSSALSISTLSLCLQ